MAPAVPWWTSAAVCRPGPSAGRASASRAARSQGEPVQIPKVGAAVAVADGEGLAVRAERQGSDVGACCRGAESGGDLFGDRVPQVGDVTICAAPVGEGLAVRAERHGVDGVDDEASGEVKGADERAGGRVPQVSAAAVISGGQDAAVRAERYVVDALVEARVTEGGGDLALDWVPQVGSAVAVTCREDSAVWAECQGADAVAAQVGEGGGDLPGGRFPQVGPAAAVAVGEDAAVRAERHGVVTVAAWVGTGLRIPAAP